jgi:hypothetical protein
MYTVMRSKFLIVVLSAFMLFSLERTHGEVTLSDLKYSLSDNVFVNPGIKSLDVRTYLVFPAEIYAGWLNKKEEENARKGYAQRNADKMEMVLMRLGFECIERSKLDRILAELQLAQSGLTEDNARKIGQLLNADAFVIITIPDMGWFEVQSTSFTDISIKAVSISTGVILLKGSTVHDINKIHDRLVVDFIETKLYDILESKLKNKL